MTIVSHAQPAASSSDHGSLTGLLDDDHTQYLLLAGRSGGQVLDAASAGLHMRWRDNSLSTLMELDDSGDALLEMFSTTQGFRPPTMTEAQRDLIGSPAAGLLVFNTDQSQLNQYNGSAWTVPGGGLTTLQGAYDNDPTGAQIVLDATPNPVAVQASVAGDVFLAQDLGANNIFQVSADPDLIEADASITIRDPFLNAAAANSLIFADTFSTGGGFLGGAQLSNGTVTYNNSFFIWALLQESKVYQAAAGPGFAAFTLFNALPRIVNSGNFDLVQALVLNCGVVHERSTSGTSNVAQTTGVSFAGQARASTSGAVLNYTTGMQLGRFAPTFSTVAGSSIDFGDLVAIDVLNPNVALFQPSAGSEAAGSICGLRIAALPFGGNIDKAAVQSSIAAASNAYFLRNLGGAQSEFGAGSAHFNDGAGIMLGIGDDVLENWNGSAYELAPSVGDDYRIAFATDVHTFSSGGSDPEMRFVANRIHFGGAGSVGNQIFNFAAPATSADVAGEFSQVLLTQAGNLTKNAALTGAFAWTINALSLSTGTGSVSGDVATLNVGGMTTSLLDTAETMAIRSTGRVRRRGTEQVPPINPANLTGNVDAWSGLLTASQNNNARGWARITCDAATNLRGIDSTGAYDGDTYDVTNVGSNALTVTNQDANPAAADRIILGAHGGTLAVDETITIRYDGTTQRWRVIST